MFDIYCPHCQRRHLLSTTQIISTHRTIDGPIAYVHCPEGHLLVKEFRANRTHTLKAWEVSHQRAS